MKYLNLLLSSLLISGCGSVKPSKPSSLETLTGTVLRKEWSKSNESWNAGGSEYFVLQVDTTKEGIILRPSETVVFDDFKKFIGQVVDCRGEFIAGTPVKPTSDSFDPMPSPMTHPVTGEIIYPVRGSGFKVHSIVRK